MSTSVVDTITLLERESCVSRIKLERPSDADPSVLVPVTLDELTDLTLTLYHHVDGTDEDADTIINSRNGVSVKNANGGTFHATNGEFTMHFSSDDNPIVGSVEPGATEDHEALFIATWGTGGQKVWIVRLRVRSLAHVS